MNVKNTSKQTPEVQVRINKVSYAKEVPSYKNIPKYNHVPHACINPSPKKRRPQSGVPDPVLNIDANPLKLKYNVREKKELEPHLLRVPFDPNQKPTAAKTFIDTKGMTVAQKKAAAEAATKAQAEAVKLKKIKRNLTILFTEIKAQLDSKQESSDFINDKIRLEVGRLRPQINDKKFISTLYCGPSKSSDVMAGKSELTQFIRAFLPKITDSEVSEILNAHRKKRDLNTTNDSIMSNDQKMDISLLDPQFDKWQMDNEALNGVLNQRVTRQKNQEFRLKCDAWKKRVNERKRIKKRTFEQGKKIREDFEVFLKDIESDSHVISGCQADYHNLAEDLQTTRKEEKIYNDLLSQVLEVAVLEQQHIDKLIEQLANVFNTEFKLLEKFAGWVKNECVLDQFYFNFHEIPELILRKKVTKKDYEQLTKLLLKVKRSFISQKHQLMSDKRIEDINITDEDLVPLDLFDVVLGQIRHKFDEKKQMWLELMAEARSEIQKKIKAMDMNNDKQKKQIYESVLINFLNTKLENTHVASFNHHYKHALIYRNFQQQKGEIRTADEFMQMFEQSIEITERDLNEYRNQLTREMNKFNGKGQLNDGTESDRSSLTYQSKGGKGGPSISPDKGGNSDDNEMGSARGSFAKGLNQLDGGVSGDEEDEAREKFKNDKQLKAEHMKSMFKDLKTGQSYDPSKKFGVIETEGTLLYDDITTAYPLNLPADYYHKYIQSQIPKEGDGKWFIRPHHIENLTQHPASIKDHVLNTHYYSHYNQSHGKEPEIDDCELACEHIESLLNELKDKQKAMSTARGKEYTDEDADELRRKQYRQAVEAFEKRMGDRNDRHDRHQLIIDAYEKILFDNRTKEKTILNGVRDKEYQKNRPPADQWYSLKSNTFNQECYRNRVALKPNNENSVYLNRLQDPCIY